MTTPEAERQRIGPMIRRTQLRGFVPSRSAQRRARGETAGTRLPTEVPSKDTLSFS